jgi:hypothetical protein
LPTRGRCRLLAGVHRPNWPANEPISAADNAYTLIDADGALTEVVGAEALRARFEQVFFGKHLSPDQIAGVWESNELARKTIEQLFGPGALGQAEEHLNSSHPPSDNLGPDPVAQSQPANPTRNSPGLEEPAESDQVFVLEIDPTWGAQKIFQHYRAALNALTDNPARSTAQIASFRHANIGVDRRLRAKLPSRMKQIDAIYRRTGLAC